MKTLTQPEAFSQLQAHLADTEDQAHRAAIRAFDTSAPLAAPVADPRRVQLLALFDMSDERGKVTLLAIAGIHAARFPKEK